MFITRGTGDLVLGNNCNKSHDNTFPVCFVTFNSVVSLYTKLMHRFYPKFQDVFVASVIRRVVIMRFGNFLVTTIAMGSLFMSADLSVS